MKSPLFCKIQTVVADTIGNCAVLFPFPQQVQLGDYGTYHDGYFRKCGNLLKFHSPETRSAEPSEMESLPEENMLLTDQHTLLGETASWIDETGVWQIQRDLYHRSLPSFALFLNGVRHYQWRIKDEMKAAVIALIQQGEWSEDYRIICQLTAVNQLSFVCVEEQNDKMTLTGPVDGPYDDPLSQNLSLSLAREEVPAGHWLPPISAVLSVNMIRFDPSGEEWICREQDGQRNDELSFIQSDHFILDNSNSYQ